MRPGEAVRHTADGVYLLSGYTETLRIRRCLPGYRKEIQYMCMMIIIWFNGAPTPTIKVIWYPSIYV